MLAVSQPISADPLYQNSPIPSIPPGSTSSFSVARLSVTCNGEVGRVRLFPYLLWLSLTALA